MKYFRYNEEENKYELVPGAPEDALLSNPVFNQAAVLHTSEEVPPRLTRAYNVEDEVAFTDGQIKLGAEERGQQVGEVSGGRFLEDRKPEYN